MSAFNHFHSGTINFFMYTCLGAGVAVLLYYAGKDGLNMFYNGTYKDEDGRIHKRMPTDDWYGHFVLRGWAFGFIVS